MKKLARKLIVALLVLVLTGSCLEFDAIRVVILTGTAYEIHSYEFGGFKHQDVGVNTLSFKGESCDVEIFTLSNPHMFPAIAVDEYQIGQSVDIACKCKADNELNTLSCMVLPISP